MTMKIANLQIKLKCLISWKIGKELYSFIKNNYKNIALWLLWNGINLDYKEYDMNDNECFAFNMFISGLSQSEGKWSSENNIIKLKTEQEFMLFIKEKDSNENIHLNVAVKYGRLDNMTCMLNMYNI